MTYNLSKEKIDELANRLIEQLGLEEKVLQDKEKLFDKLRACECRLVKKACATQRDIDKWKKEELRARSLRFKRMARKKATKAFRKIQLVAQRLLTFTQVREQCQSWLTDGYILKTLPGRHTGLSETEEARMARFRGDVEYSVGAVADGMVRWFQLHNLALDEVSAIRAAMEQVVSLFPLED